MDFLHGYLMGILTGVAGVFFFNWLFATLAPVILGP
jgi:hypothetical protein